MWAFTCHHCPRVVREDGKALFRYLYNHKSEVMAYMSPVTYVLRLRKVRRRYHISIE